MQPIRDLGENFGQQMELMGQIHALLKVEMHIMAERQMLEAELAKVKEKEPKTNQGELNETI